MAATGIQAIATRSTFQFEGDTAELRLYPTQSFLSSTGQMVGQGSPWNTESWYLPVACEVQAGNILYVPYFAIDSTTDGQPRTSKYIAALFDEGGAYVGPFPLMNPNGFAIPPPELMPTPTWGQLQIYNRLPTLLYPPQTFPTRDEMYAAIAAAIGQGAPLASATVIGISELTRDPDDPALPIAFGANEPIIASIETIIWADQYAGATTTLKIQAAIDAAGLTDPMLVVIPSTMGSSSATFDIPDNVRILDLRGLNAPDPAGGGGYTDIRGVVLRSRWTEDASGIPGPTLSTLLVFSNPSSGGVNETGEKTNYIGLYAPMHATTPGQHTGMAADIYDYSNGDTQGVAGVARSWGSVTAVGDEGCVGGRFSIQQGDVVFSATVSGVVGEEVSYSSASNAYTRGEGRPLIITTPAKVYSTGTFTNVSGTPPTVTGSGTAWATQFGAGAKTNLFFEFDAEANGALKMVVPIRSITNDTSLVLDYTALGADQAWAGVTSGNYKIYKGGMVTAIALAGSVTVSPATDFAATDTVEQPLGYAFLSSGAIVIAAERSIRSIVNGGGIYLTNTGGSLRLGDAIQIVGLWTRGIHFTSSISGSGIAFDDAIGGSALSLGDTTVDALHRVILVARNSGNAQLTYNKATDFWAFGAFGIDAVTGSIGVKTTPQAGTSVYVNASGTSIGIEIQGNTTGALLNAAISGVPRLQVTNTEALFNNGIDLNGYSDNQSTLKWAIDGATGAASFGTLAVGSSGTALTKVLKGTVTIDPTSINATTVSSQTFTLTGAVVGDTLILNPPAAGLTAGLLVTQVFVSSGNVVTIVFYNTSGAPIDEASASWTYTLIRS